MQAFIGSNGHPRGTSNPSCPTLTSGVLNEQWGNLHHYGLGFICGNNPSLESADPRRSQEGAQQMNVLLRYDTRVE